MKVVGTGVDLVEVTRFHRAVERWGQRLLTRLFTSRELAYCSSRRGRAQHLAARFAAKEAVVKALGAPKGLGLQWQDLEVAPSATGQPQVVFHGRMSRWSDLQVYLSLTHTRRYAVATALVTAA